MEGNAPAFLEQHAHVLDDYFRDSFLESTIGPKMDIARNPYAIIALGGYGREEQCIHSDVDLLFLFGKKVPDEAEDIIREVVYPLWDLGLDIGHATRSIKECTSLASQDIEVLTSLLDARYICGESLLYLAMMEELREKVVKKKADKLVRHLVKKNKTRHEYFGDSAYLLEPNLKDGQGGIRDYHTMLWIARIKSNLRKPRDLEFFGYLTSGGFEALSETLFFIWNVRNHLHHLTGRKCDQLHLEYQHKLAATMHFDDENGRLPVEKFLGKLHSRMESLKLQYLIFLQEHGYETPKKCIRKATLKSAINGLKARQGMLGFISSANIIHTPELLIDIFIESSRLKIPLNAEARQLIKEFAYLVNDDFRASGSISKSFEKILTSPAIKFNVLQEMLNTGFLEHYIPRFKGIVNRIQYDEYHLYPVDKHSLLTVKAIKDFRTTEDPLCNSLYKNLPNKKILFWAALLHDIGKGEQGKGHAKRGAAMITDVLKAFNLKPKDVDTISFLVEEHLLLPKTATRRDINDEETAISCARRIKEITRLKMLYLLSIADSKSTGPKAWNDWTGALIRSLFLKVLSILEMGELASKKAIKTLEIKKEDAFAMASTPQEKKNLEELHAVMSPRYLLDAHAKDMLEHIKLYKSLGDNKFIWKVDKISDRNTRTITICANDQPGLFSKIAGTFTFNNLDILDSRIYTWRNNIALDIFKVKAPADRIFEDEIWARTKKYLESVLSGQQDLSKTLKKKMAEHKSRPHLSERPNQIVVDNESSSFFTIIEVTTYNFPGLLYSITNTLFKCRLDVWVAKIATQIDQVVDIFYVRDFDGQKVDSLNQEETIKKEIAAVLPGSF